MKELPEKLSALLRLAVEDAKKAEASDKYALAMGIWHEPATVSQRYVDKFGEDKCIVCLAGAVMAFSLECSPAEPFWPDRFTASTESDEDEDDDVEEEDRSPTTRKLLAIDSLRTGDIVSAYRELTGAYSHEVPDALEDLEKAWLNKYFEADHAEMLRYGGAMPWEWYEEMAQQLEAIGQ